jgi:hypothetical protein
MEQELRFKCDDCERLKNACLAAAERLSKARLDLARCPDATVEFARLWRNCTDELKVSVELRDETQRHLSRKGGAHENGVFQGQSCKDGVQEAFDLLASLVSARRHEGRQQRRFPTSSRAFLRVLSPFSPETWPAEITGVSREGLGLLVKAPLRSDMLVQVRIGTSFVLAEVIYSTPAEPNGFRVGVRITDVI